MKIDPFSCSGRIISVRVPKPDSGRPNRGFDQLDRHDTASSLPSHTSSLALDRNELATYIRKFRDKAPPLSTRPRVASISKECGVSSLYGVSRGPACILERLSEALARIVSGRLISGEQRERENQLQSDQQKDRQPHQIPKGRRGDRRRGRFNRHRQGLRGRQRAVYRNS